jgi:hypothetical protein
MAGWNWSQTAATAPSQDDEHLIAPSIQNSGLVRFGGITLNPRTGPWTMDTLLHREGGFNGGGGTLPGLGLACFAEVARQSVLARAGRSPSRDDRIVYSLDSAALAAVIRIEQPTRSTVGMSASIGPPVKVPATSFSPSWNDDEIRGILPTDHVLRTAVVVPPDAALRASTATYTELFSSDPDEEARVRSLVRGKVAMIANVSGSDWFELPDGRRRCAVHGHAAALEGMLAGTTIRGLPVVIRIMVTGACALLALVLVWLFQRGFWRVVGLFVFFILLGLAAICAFRYAQILVDPYAPVGAAVVAAALSWRVRALHRSRLT